MLIIENVTKAFNKGRNLVLEGAHFHIKDNEVVGLFGRNGTGKSTLFKILFGILKADEFSGKLNDLEYCPRLNTKTQTIAYLPQDSFLPSHLYVTEIFEMMINDDLHLKKVFEAPEVLRLMNFRFNKLSAGQKKYVEFLCIIYLPHPICLLDEPYAMVDPLHKELISNLIIANKMQKTIVVSDHYYEEVLSVCDRLLLIKEGKINEITNRRGLQIEGYLPNR